MGQGSDDRSVRQGFRLSDGLIAGGESGPKHRPMRIEWARELRDRCLEEGVSQEVGLGVAGVLPHVVLRRCGCGLLWACELGS